MPGKINLTQTVQINHTWEQQFSIITTLEFDTIKSLMELSAKSICASSKQL